MLLGQNHESNENYIRSFELQTADAHRGPIDFCGISRDGAIGITGVRGKEAIIWDCRKGAEIRRLSAEGAQAFAISHDGHIQFIARQNRIDVHSMLRESRSIPWPEHTATSLYVSPKSTRLAAIDLPKREIAVFEVSTTKLVFTASIPHNSCALDFSPDEKSIALVRDVEPHLMILELDKNPPVTNTVSKILPNRIIRYFSDSKRLVCADNQHITVIDTTGRVHNDIKLQDHSLGGLTPVDNGLIYGNRSGIYHFDLKSETKQFQTMSHTQISFAGNGETFIATSRAVRQSPAVQGVRIGRLSRDKVQFLCGKHAADVTALAFNGAGDRVVTVDLEGKSLLLNSKTGALVSEKFIDGVVGEPGPNLVRELTFDAQKKDFIWMTNSALGYRNDTFRFPDRDENCKRVETLSGMTVKNNALFVLARNETGRVIAQYDLKDRRKLKVNEFERAGLFESAFRCSLGLSHGLLSSFHFEDNELGIYSLPLNPASPTVRGSAKIPWSIRGPKVRTINTQTAANGESFSAVLDEIHVQYGAVSRGEFNVKWVDLSSEFRIRGATLLPSLSCLAVWGRNESSGRGFLSVIDIYTHAIIASGFELSVVPKEAAASIDDEHIALVSDVGTGVIVKVKPMLGDLLSVSQNTERFPALSLGDAIGTKAILATLRVSGDLPLILRDLSGVLSKIEKNPEQYLSDANEDRAVRRLIAATANLHLDSDSLAAIRRLKGSKYDRTGAHRSLLKGVK